ncbi:MAG TPA: pyruvate:ferredoxin (flavodoxin) oxidoreductase [Bacillota bacterium]|nr:pyruvate:ferredoxin (flavodoxin) oxidoreductase [Bacillota bacterium]
MAKHVKTMDGNEAAAYISYPFTEVAAIYPITPSSPMAEGVDEWSAHGKKNFFGQEVKVAEMQSEAGAAGAVHGSLTAGALTTTYTASQGLLLMLPNMYKISGELLPCVFHVSARALAAHALSIFGDHQDVMAARQTGFALLASTSVQEVLDLGAISHLASIKSRIPFLHFFDGFRTSHEYQRIESFDYEDIEHLVDYKAIDEFRKRAINPNHPVVRGTAQNPDIYFQGREVSNKYFDAVPGIVSYYMKEMAKVTGREYNLFDYYGAPDAEHVIIAMGSVCDTIDETVDHLMAQGKKVGTIRVRLYRPFSAKHFLEVMPDTVKKVAVLDRTKEPGSLGEPLYQDILHVFAKQDQRPITVGGRYGLGSKDTTPTHIMSVYKNLEQAQPKDNFTIGIVDDVTNTSLPEHESIDTTPEGTISCKVWGLGSDGTVGANKSAIKIIGDETDLYAQGYFSYDSKKSGGTTVSHLRFGDSPIKAPYLVNEPDYIGCHNKSFLHQTDVIKGIKAGSTFVLNCDWSVDELDEELPAELRKTIYDKNLDFYTIDAVKIASEIGLGNRINMVMQAAFFKLTKVIPLDEAIQYLKDSIVEVYGRKGERIVKMNHDAVDQGVEALVKVDVPESWANPEMDAVESDDDLPDYITNIQQPMARMEGDELPVSTFEHMADGTFPMGTTAYEKRGIAVLAPEWQIDNCIQCNQCSYVCPHATIRPYLLDDEELAAAPDSFKTKKPVGKGVDGLHYRIQLFPMDCVGCGNCADVCPSRTKALIMKPADDMIEAELENSEYAVKVKEKEDVMSKYTLKGSQFKTPLFEFHGACPGCGETPYIKLLTQLYGDRMMIANATGCSSIYGASAPSMPYTVNSQGKGPAWANSLFEDNAEFGYGMYLGVKQIREKVASLVDQGQSSDLPGAVKDAMGEWLDKADDGEDSREATKKLLQAIKNEDCADNPIVKEILEKENFLVKPSQWIIGGDGWAYDIDYGGLDHVLASGDDVNILVLDTEVYSNTGGQSSKATPTAAVAKFAAAGKKIRKKDLGAMAMNYGYVYVTQIALGANMSHTIRAIAEAERYKGPSLIIAYSPCINHGIRTGMGTTIAQEKLAVESGYWHLYRYNPELKEEGKNPFQLDSREPKLSFRDFLNSEVRYTSLKNTFPDIAEEMFDIAEDHARERYENYKRMAAMDYSKDE